MDTQGGGAATALVAGASPSPLSLCLPLRHPNIDHAVLSLSRDGLEAHGALVTLQRDLLAVHLHSLPLAEVVDELEARLGTGRGGRRATVDSAKAAAGATLSSVLRAILDESTSLSSSAGAPVAHGAAGTAHA